MKIVIDIPKEFEEHYRQDKFEDTFHRLSADAHLIAGNYEQETAIMLIKAFNESEELQSKSDGMCEWKQNTVFLEQINNPHCSETQNISTTKYCPYCGKKIKVVE